MSTEYHIRKVSPKRRYVGKAKLERPFSMVRKQSEKVTTRTIIRKKSDLHQLLATTSNHFSSLGLSSASWCLYDSVRVKEIGFRQSYQREIASLTKIMTTIVSIELMSQFNINANLLVRVTNASAQQIGTSAFLKENSWIRVEDLLYGAMMPSGNDAAYLLAEVFGFFLLASRKSNSRTTNYFSTVDRMDLTGEFTTNLYFAEFLKAMNTTATKLKMNNSRFSNPHGLPNAMNSSSAKDVIVLSQYACANNKFRDIMNTHSHSYFEFENQWEEGKTIKKWVNTNQLLKKGWDGLKTGQTNSAGNCLASLKNGIYIVVLNCNSNDARFAETEKLYRWYHDNYGLDYSTVDFQ